jgi:glutamate synthase (NADPH/NADH) large chain
MTGGRVVILGRVGKNFAAGMSGGVAYVLAEDKEHFAALCNREMVLLEALDDEHEIAEVKRLVERHVQYTGSRHAQSLLDQWQETVTKFVKVIPKEYKRMLSAITEWEQSGMNREEAVLAAFAASQKKGTAKETKRKAAPAVYAAAGK